MWSPAIGLSVRHRQTRTNGASLRFTFSLHLRMVEVSSLTTISIHVRHGPFSFWICFFTMASKARSGVNRPVLWRKSWRKRKRGGRMTDGKRRQVRHLVSPRAVRQKLPERRCANRRQSQSFLYCSSALTGAQTAVSPHLSLPGNFCRSKPERSGRWGLLEEHSLHGASLCSVQMDSIKYSGWKPVRLLIMTRSRHDGKISILWGKYVGCNRSICVNSGIIEIICMVKIPSGGVNL